MEEKKTTNKSKNNNKSANSKNSSLKKQTVVSKNRASQGQNNINSNVENKRTKEANDEAFLYALKNKETIDTVNPQKEAEPVEEVVEIVEENDENITRYYDTPIDVGLSSEIIEQRKADGLVNVATNEKGKSVLKIILSNIFTFFNMLYFVIAIILIIFQSYGNLGFLPLILANLAIGIFQEIRAKKTVEKMNLLAAPTATVIRDGVKLEIPVSEIVLDDIILYTSGKQICSDSIVVEGNVEVNESLLTGESDAIVKNKGDQLFSGSFIVSGVCVARVDKIGNDNYIEKLSVDAKKYGTPRSELLITLRGIIKIVTILIIPITILYLWSAGLIFSKSGTADTKVVISQTAYIILAMIPAGLFLLTSLALFAGVIRLSKNKTLVQELYCIEMLARVDVLCLDKTGTITDGTMRVCDCVEVKNYTEYTIREIVGSMMNALEDRNPTSEALVRYFDVNKVLTPISTIPFSSKRKYSAVTFENEGTFIIGAPEFVLKDSYSLVEAKVARFAKQGCRVLVLGHTTNKIKDGELPKTVKPLALIVIQDHIREDASNTIEFFKNNGVDVKVISGDNPETVSEIAQRVGIENAERYISLHGLSDDEVRAIIFDYTVFGRVTPNQKKIIVQELKAHKKTVAMTGDGVNDILALKEADCSIAMASGSDATRYVSHLVLMDSNFASMPKVVNEGRRVINNIQKSSSLYLTKNLYAILLAIMYIIVGFTTGSKYGWPFEAKHFYLIEWFILGIATTALALQPNTDIVKGKFLGNVVRGIFPAAITILLFNLGLYFLREIPGFKDTVFANKDAFVTIAAIINTVVMIMVLFDSCKPFNWIRKVIFSATIVLILLAVFLKPDFFGLDFKAINNVPSILLLICLLQFTYPLMWLVSFVFKKIKITR